MGPVVTKRKKEKKIVKALVRNGIVEENRKNSLEMRVERKKKVYVGEKMYLFFPSSGFINGRTKRKKKRKKMKVTFKPKMQYWKKNRR